MFRVLISVLVVWGVGASPVRSEAPPPSEQPERAWTVCHLENIQAGELAKVIVQLLKCECIVASKPDAPVRPQTIVLSEPTTNSLLVSAPADALKKIETLVARLDTPTPMVRVELLIVEFAKGDRSRSSETSPNEEEASAEPPETAPMSAEQLKRELGLAKPGASAAAEEVALRIAALQRAGRLRMVRRPQILALNNKTAQLTIGRSEPYVAGSSFTKFGQQNAVNYRQVGLDLSVTPRVTPDGVVTMEINLSESHLGPVEEGVPIAVTDKRTLRSPAVTSTKARSVVRLHNGQTVVLGGVSTKGPRHEPEQLILVTVNVIRN